MNIFAKSSVLNVWLGSEYVFPLPLHISVLCISHCLTKILWGNRAKFKSVILLEILKLKTFAFECLHEHDPGEMPLTDIKCKLLITKI